MLYPHAYTAHIWIMVGFQANDGGETWHGAWWEALSKVKVNSSSHWDIKKSLIKKKEKKGFEKICFWTLYLYSPTDLNSRSLKGHVCVPGICKLWVGVFSLKCTALTRPLTNLTNIDSDLVKQPLCREPHLRSPYLSPIYSAGWSFKQEGEAV